MIGQHVATDVANIKIVRSLSLIPMGFDIDDNKCWFA